MEPDMKKKKRKSGVRQKSAKQKVTLLEKAIAELEAKLPDAQGKEAGGIERQLRIHREELRIQKIHVISKLSSVSHYVVDGSYGSSG
jgi:hypothetical protein